MTSPGSGPRTSESWSATALTCSNLPYADVDLAYGWRALEEKTGFTLAQCECLASARLLTIAFLNVIEAALNIVSLLLGDHPAAPLVAVIALSMTSSKTILYMVQGEFRAAPELSSAHSRVHESGQN